MPSEDVFVDLTIGSGNRLLVGSVILLSLVAAGCASNASGTLARQSETGLYIRAPGVIAAQNFILVNSAGRPLAELSSAPQGGAGLVLLDPNAKARAALITTPTGEPGLKFYDAKGTVRAAAVVRNDSSAGIALYDANGRSRAALTETPAGEASLVLYDSTGRQIAVVPDTSQASHQLGGRRRFSPGR
jgi:hypothetical protein